MKHRSSNVDSRPIIRPDKGIWNIARAPSLSDTTLRFELPI
jgi:hypothetical protein